VDVWSCGVTLFNLISGEYPFDGDSLMKLFDNITHQPISWPENVEIGPELHKLLTNVLDKNPEKRWNSTAIRASTWFNSTFDVVSSSPSF
jgi:serine/threonine-protein kinase 11